MTQAAAANQFKSAAYDHPSYTTRQAAFQGVLAAGAGVQSPKYMAHANLLLFALNVMVTAAGTSTATQTVNGTATVHVNSQVLSAVVVTNTASAGVAPALTTSTIGPFYADALYANGTYTGAPGAYANLPLNTATGPAGLNGLPFPVGSQIYIAAGTDASAAEIFTIDYQIQPLASFAA